MQSANKICDIGIENWGRSEGDTIEFHIWRIHHRVCWSPSVSTKEFHPVWMGV
jgi:hypothetical protein